MPLSCPSLALILSMLGAVLPDDPGVGRCADRLRTIGRALESYRRDRGKRPDTLAELVPAYLPDAAALRCPSSTTGDGPAGDSYRMGGEVSGGLAAPPGPAPPSDIPGASWGTERNVTLWLRRFYGDRVPVVRCAHHGSRQAPRTLNLTLEGAVYEGGPEWEGDPDTVAELLRRAGRDLADDPRRFDREWNLFALDDYAHDWGRVAGSGSVMGPMRILAEALDREGPRLKGPATAYRLAARLELALGRFARAEAAARSVLAMPGKAEEEGARQLLAEALRGLGRNAEAVDVFRSMLRSNPDSRNIRAQLAEALAASGRRGEADELLAAIDPGRELVGRPAPAFRAPRLRGPEAEVGGPLRGKKAMLVNFWFHRCVPCREEFPRLQALYDALKDKGLDVLAINSDDDRETIARYVETSGWTFPIALGREARGSINIPAAYRVDLFPTNVLIDAEGQVVFRCTGWDEAGLRAALAKLGVR
jgi:thiol-disulfide isomerase/thioredoxin